MPSSAGRLVPCLIALAAAGCGGGDGPAGPPPETVWTLSLGPTPRVVLPPTTPLTVELGAWDSTGTPLQISRTSVEWASSNPDIVTVSRDGVVRVVATAPQGAQSLVSAKYGRGQGFLEVYAALPPIGARVVPERTVTPGARLLLRGLAVNPQGLEEEGHYASFSIVAGGANARLSQVGCPPDTTQCVFHAPDLAWLYADAVGDVTVRTEIDGQSGTATNRVRTLSFTSVTAGGHTCGTTTDGALFCWGLDYLRTPIQVELPNLDEVQAGPTRTCALDASRLAYCWRPDPDPAPEPVSTTVRFSRLAIGYESSCGLDLDGKAWCWGANTYGQLGDGSRISSAAPVPVAGGHTFADIAIYNTHACALTPGGEAYCWGASFAGELGAPVVPGDGCVPDVCSAVPLRAADGHLFEQIVAGDNFTCGRTAEGAVWCWGVAGKLGAGNPPAPPGAPGPVQVGGGKPFTTITAGTGHACGLTPEGLALCWGVNTLGQAGQAPSDVVYTPAIVRGARSFTAIDAGTQHNCALDEDGLYCWGDNEAAQLGNSEPSGSPPSRVAGQP